MLVNKNSIEATLNDFTNVGEDIDSFNQEEIELIFQKTFKDLADNYYQEVFKQNCLKVKEERKNIYKISDVLVYLQSFDDDTKCKLHIKIQFGVIYKICISNGKTIIKLKEVKEFLKDAKNNYGDLEVLFSDSDLNSLKIVTPPVESYLTLA